MRQEDVGLRFVAERPVSRVTSAFVTWVCAKVTAVGKTALREGHGLRIVRCPLPSKSPWLNPLEAHWVHGKRAVVEPTRLRTAAELVERVNTHFGCPYEAPLSIPQEVS